MAEGRSISSSAAQRPEPMAALRIVVAKKSDHPSQMRRGVTVKRQRKTTWITCETARQARKHQGLMADTVAVGPSLNHEHEHALTLSLTPVTVTTSSTQACKSLTLYPVIPELMDP